MIHELKFKYHFRRHGEEVHRFARSILGQAEDAEDATQEVFVRLWKSLNTIKGAQVRPWLFRTTRNYCIDRIRRRSDRITFTGDSESFEQHADESQSNPQQAAESSEFRLRFDAALQELPENWRSVFILYEINGLRYREIAETLEMPINSVKVYLSRARKELQKHLNPEKTWIPN